MTTAQNDRVVVEATGLVRLCSYCVPRARRLDLHRAHRVTDSICSACASVLHAEMDATEARRPDRREVLDVERVIEDAQRLRRVA